MLFSGSTAIPSKREVKKEKKSDRDEKLEVQEAVFLRWLASIVEDDIRDYKDLYDVRHLAAVAQLVTGQNITLSGSRLEDVSAVFLAVGEVKATPAEFVEGQQKAVLNTWWALVQLFWKRFGPPPINEEKVSEAIRKWCVEAARRYEETAIVDFTSSWRDGFAFNVLLHSFDPKSISMDAVSAMSAHERLEGAFALAEEKYGVPRLLTIRDLSSEHLDPRATVTYLMSLYLSLLGRSNVGKVLQQSAASSSSSFLTSSSLSAPSSRSPLVLSSDGSEGVTTVLEQLPVSAVAAAEAAAYEAQQTAAAAAAVAAAAAAGTAAAAAAAAAAPQERLSRMQQAHQMRSVDQGTEETSTSLRSRKSSSSSQRSSRSRKARKEELAREFEACLEHVLAWLLEAEEEVESLSDVESRDVVTVKRQFKEYELLMASLTESQETVGRVLHRGQVLMQRVDDPQEKEQVQQQLVLVNTRWEQLRELAMARQASLQSRLNALQTSRISEIAAWLTEMEKQVERAEPLADTAEGAVQQIAAHAQLQQRIDEYQSTIDQLGSFVAVIEEDEEGDASLAALEQRLASIGSRWAALCEWSERRAGGLDGLAELCQRTELAYATLEEWLKTREQDLLGLRSVHHLETEEEVQNQIVALRTTRDYLEREHNQIVAVSRLANESVQRLETENGEGANKVRRRLDAINQRWENLVTRVEEQSRMLVQAGKADKAAVYGEDASRRRRSESASDQEGRAITKVVDRFVQHVTEMEAELGPLREWTNTFTVSKKPDQVRRMISVCQEKLVEIKEKEAGVARLQLELEHLHMAPRMSARDLKTANDAFHRFNKSWAKVVTKISEALNVLSGQAEVGEEAEVAHGIEEWMEATQRVLGDVAKIANHEERAARVEKLRAQLTTQRENLAMIQRDAARKAILGKGLDILSRKMDALGEAPAEERLIKEVDGEWSSVGDEKQLEEDVVRSEKLVEMARKAEMPADLVERAETRRAEMEERKRVTSTAEHALGVAEKKIKELSTALATSNDAGVGVAEGWKKLKELRKEMDENEKMRKEAERAAEKMLAVDDGVPKEVVDRTRARVRALQEGWKGLHERLDESLILAEKEAKKTANKKMGERQRTVDELEKELEESEKATDAEEYSEHLDNLENLLDKVKQTKADSLADLVQGMDESLVRDNYSKLNESIDRATEKAEKRIEELAGKAADAEKFEKSAVELGTWAGHIAAILSLRKHADISALDVPAEYKNVATPCDLAEKMAREFEDRDALLEEMERLADSAPNERTQAQMEHAKKTMAELKEQLASFRHPASYTTKVQKAWQRLCEWENRLDEMVGLEINACRDALQEARELGGAIDRMGEELSSLDEGRERLLAEKILSPPEGERVEQTVKRSKQKRKELLVRAESTIDRLDDCLIFVGKMNDEGARIDGVLDSIEKRIGEFARSDGAPEDDGAVQELLVEWNRNEGGLKELEQYERIVREKGARGSEQLFLSRRTRADTLKEVLDGWQRTLQAMEDDSDTLMLQVEEMHDDLERRLEEAEKEEGKQLSTTLSFLRGARDRLSARARRLCTAKPRLSLNDLVGDVNAKFKRLEERLETHGDARPGPLLEDAAREKEEEQEEEGEGEPEKKKERKGLVEQITSLRERLAKARDHFDLDRYPVASIADWAKRVGEVESWLSSVRPAVEEAIMEGRRLANEGSAELSTHQAIEELDKIVEDTQKLEEDCESARDALSGLEEEEERLREDLAMMEGSLRELLGRNLRDPEVVKSTRRALLDKESALADVSRRASELHCALPGRSSALRSTLLDPLNQLLNQLDEELSRVGQEEEDEQEIKDQFEKIKYQSKEEPQQMRVLTVEQMPEEEIKDQEMTEIKDQPASPKLLEKMGELSGAIIDQAMHESVDEVMREEKAKDQEEEIKEQLQEIKDHDSPEPEVEFTFVPKPVEQTVRLPEVKEQEIKDHKEEIKDQEPAERKHSASPSKKRDIMQPLRSRSPSLAMEVEDTGKTTEDELEMKRKKTDVMAMDTPPRARTISRQGSEGGIVVRKISGQPEPRVEETPKREELQLQLQQLQQEKGEEEKEEKGQEKRGIDDVAQLYVTLDSLEDDIAFDEEFPLESLETAKERFDKMDADLASAAAIVHAHAMTMEMNESEQAGERIEQLKSDIAHRRQRAIDHRPEWEAFQKILAEASSDVAALEEEQKKNEEGASEEAFAKTERSVCETVRQLAGVLPRMVEGGKRSEGLRKETASLEDRFRAVGYALRETRAKRAAQDVDEAAVCKALEELSRWCSDAAADAAPPPTPANSLDAAAAKARLQAVLARISQMHAKKATLGRLESDRDRLVSLDRGDTKTKHAIRRGVSETAKQMSDLRLALAERRADLEAAAEGADEFWKMVDDTARLAAETTRDAEAVCAATVYTPSPAKMDEVRAGAAELKRRASEMEERVAGAMHEEAPLEEAMRVRVDDVLEACAHAQRAATRMPTPSLMVESTSDVSTAASFTRQPSTERREERREMEEEEHDQVAEDEQDEYGPHDDHLVMASSLHTSSLGAAPPSDSIPSVKEKKLSDRDQQAMQILTLASHWLTEAARDASITVDVADAKEVKARSAAILTIIEQLREREREVIGVSDAHAEPTVKQRAHSLLDEMEDLLRRAERRRLRLNDLSEESRAFEQARAAMELWLTDGEDVLGRPIHGADRDDLRAELNGVEAIISQLEEKREKMRELNGRADHLMDTYEREDLHALSHQLSKMNGHWSTFNDNIRIRRALLEASLRSRSDLHTALGEVEEWLEKTQTRVEQLSAAAVDPHLLKDSGRRKDAREKLEELDREVAAHADVVNDVTEMSGKVLEQLERGKERDGLQQRMASLTEAWEATKARCTTIRQQVERAESEWEGLRRKLAELLAWTDQQSRDLVNNSAMAGNLSSALHQVTASKNLAKQLEERTPKMKVAIQEANAYLMQHDLRRKMASGGVLEGEDEMEERDPITAEEQRCGLQLAADVERLKVGWARLQQQHTEWSAVVTAGAARLQSLERALAECQLGLTGLETELESSKPVEDLRLEQLGAARKDADVLTERVNELRGQMDEANAASAAVSAADAPLDAHPTNQLEAVNKRYDSLRASTRVRVAAISNALKNLGPSSEHFLAQSVQLPWQRAVSATNRLPYYIDHKTERTQWDHPAWVELSRELATFNRVKFIAYRTAMKLRALQKRLCLDLISLDELDKAFSRLDLSSEESISLESMVTCLVPVYEQLHLQQPHVIRSLSLAIDLVVNLVLNIYDPGRDGLLRTLSFKVALVVLCAGTLEEKYRYLFSLVAQTDHVDQKHMALLFYDLVHMPKLVGECAAFGGTNIEPSVRSLFETVRLSPTIALPPYLAWLKAEPQSLVWLPVMHRFATAEFAKHQAKCNVCKMFPIVGLRYRCLRCFNFDMCQNCFFSQRTSKNHKLKHPMQEYSTPTTSGEDVRDFGRIVKNKLTGSKRHLGYLPIELGEEGKPLAAPSVAQTNPATGPLHSRSSAAAARLGELSAHEVAQPAAPRDPPTSPIQMMNQVEMMQKDELDQLLQRLQLENMELKREVEKRKRTMQSQPNLERDPSAGPRAGSEYARNRGLASESATSPVLEREGRSRTLPRLGTANQRASVPTLHTAASTNDVEEEARALRLHQSRLESRSRILAAQNEQLELQLSRVKKLIEQQKTSPSRGGLDDLLDGRSMEREEREWSMNGTLERAANDNRALLANGGHREGGGERGDDARGERMQSLLDTVDELGKAMESLVVSVVYNSDSEVE